MAKHFMIYYKKGTGTYIVTEPRPWARENRNYFPNFDFDVNHPNVSTIENYLIDNHNFQRVEYQNDSIVVLFNLNPNINL